MFFKRTNKFDKEKFEFINNEIQGLVIGASIKTRNPLFPFYNKNIEIAEKSKVIDFIKDYLNILFSDIKNNNGNISEEDLISRIDDFSKKMSRSFKSSLFKNKINIGISQKIITLYLKYLWCLGLISKPPLCPIDNKILKMWFGNNQKINWTEIESMEDYKKIIDEIKQNTQFNHLADWELKTWNSQKDSSNDSKSIKIDSATNVVLDAGKAVVASAIDEFGPVILEMAKDKLVEKGKSLFQEHKNTESQIKSTAKSLAKSDEINYAKKCTKCGKVKLNDDFNKDNSKPDGKQSWCKECLKEHRETKIN